MIKRRLINGPYVLWMIAFTIIPLCTIAYYGFTNRQGDFTWDNIAAIADPLHFKSLFLALGIALGCTVICLLISYPLVLILVNSRIAKTSFIIFVFILPMWMNYMLRTMALQQLLTNNGIINGILRFMHLPALNLINTPQAIMLGMVYIYLPFMILPIYNAVSKIDHSMIEAAQDLGGSYFTVLRRIIIPLSSPGIISGITMVFIPAISEFVIANILGGGKILLIGNVIEQEFTTVNNWYLGSGLSLVLMVFILISMFIAGKYDKEGSGSIL